MNLFYPRSGFSMFEPSTRWCLLANSSASLVPIPFMQASTQTAHQKQASVRIVWRPLPNDCKSATSHPIAPLFCV